MNSTKTNELRRSESDKEVAVKREDKSTVLSQDLIQRLGHLRKSAREASRIHLANLEQGILETIELVADLENRKLKKERRHALLQEMQKALDEVRIKPEKGRRRDFKRIEEAIRLIGTIASSPK